jgi:hypothetical protein
MTTASSKPKSWRDVLPVHPAAEQFELLSPDELKALGEDIRKNGLQQAIIISSKSNGDELLLDGRNRLDAMERVGVKFNLKRHKHGWWNLDILEEGVPTINIDLAYTIGDSVDPYDYVIGANIRRRHLTAEQKRDLIEKLISATPEKSDRQIADEIKSNRTTVGQIRKRLETSGDVSIVDTRTDSKGRRQPAHKPPTPPATTPKATTDSALVQATPELIAAVHDKIIAKCVADVTTHIAEAVDHLDDIECVALLERLQAIINMLLATANRKPDQNEKRSGLVSAAESILGEEPPKAAERATEPMLQPDEMPDIPPFLRRQPS